MASNLFVTYTHPSQQQNKKTRKAIASYVARKAARAPSSIDFEQRPRRLEWTHATSGKHASSQPASSENPSPASLSPVLLAQQQGAIEEARDTPQSYSTTDSDIEVIYRPEDGVQELEQNLRTRPSSGQPWRLELSHGYRVDPFASLPAENQDCVSRAVDHFIHVWSSAQVPFSINAGSRHPLVSHFFPFAIENRDLFEALVAGSQSCLEAGGAPADLVPSKNVLSHQVNAITLVRKKLSKPVKQIDDALLFTITYLMDVDLIFGNFKSFRSHLAGLNKLLAARGELGDSWLHQILRAYLASIEFYCETMRYLDGAATQADLPRLEPPLPKASSPEIEDATLFVPPGFGRLMLEGKLSRRFIRLIVRMSEWSLLVEDTNSETAQSDYAARVLLCSPVLDVRDAAILLQDLPKTIDPTIERCLCLAFICYVRNARSAFRTTAVYRRLLLEFLEAVEEFQPRSTGEEECYIWVSVIAVSAASSKAGFQSRGCQLMDTLISAYTKARNWVTLGEILAKFFWFGHLAPEWKSHWENGIARQIGLTTAVFGSTQSLETKRTH